MSDISFLVGLKNNLADSKQFYKNFRENYPEEELVFVSYGSSDGTHDWLDSLADKNLKYYYNAESRTLSDTYNKATEIATKNYVCFLHNDMVVGRKFVENASPFLQDDKVLCYRAVEPPIFEDDKKSWKTVQDFGKSFDDFNHSGFYDFESQNLLQKPVALPTGDTTFFLIINRDILLKINGLDSLFCPMFCEDDDLILRLKLAGFTSLLLTGSMVYHFVSKTSRFSDEYREKTRLIEERSMRNFIRKWGFANNSVCKKSYDTGIVINNCDAELLHELEPFGRDIYTDFPVENYCKEEQENTVFNLKEKFKKLSDKKNNGVLVYVDGRKFNKKSLAVLRSLPEIIYKHTEKKPTIIDAIFRRKSKSFTKGKMKVEINNPETFEKSFIIRKND